MINSQLITPVMSAARASEIAASFDLRALPADFYTNPYPVYDELRQREPLRRMPDRSLFLTRYADDLAAWLNMSARTLHRQLQEEGASLQQLKDSVRRDLAVALLQRSSRPMKQIAEAVGFQNEKSFMRAFKNWTGATPESFRHDRNKVAPS